MMKFSDTIEGLNVSVYIQLQTSISFLKLDTGSQSWGPSTQYNRLKMISPIFKATYLKKYLAYTDETFRDYRGVACLWVYQISDLYLFFKVRYRISKLGSQSVIQPTQMISPISKSKAPYLNLHLICLFVLLL